jgi:hypothetical protein
MPDLTPPAAGLRRIWNNSKQASKVSVQIPPGEVLAVSEGLAEQLALQDSHLQPVPYVVTEAESAQVAEDVARAVKGKRAR